MTAIHDLPFTSDIPFEHERIGAAAVYCSDGRYGRAIAFSCLKDLQKIIMIPAGFEAFEANASRSAGFPLQHI